MFRNGSLTVVAALAGAIAMTGAMCGAAAAQEDCPRGTLDNAYCDRNGDLVADAPTDPKKIINPSTLIFAYTPVEDPAVYQKVWDGFLKNLEKVTGKKIVFFPVQSNAAQYEAMRSGRLHIAGVNAGGNALAVNCAGFVPFAMMAAPDRTIAPVSAAMTVNDAFRSMSTPVSRIFTCTCTSRRSPRRSCGSRSSPSGR